MSKINGDTLSIAEGKTGAHRQHAMPELNASLQDGAQAQLGTQPGSMTVTPYKNGGANTDNTALGGTLTQSAITTTSPSNASPATANSSTLIKRFTCFPKLPPELRENIWKFTLPDNRVVTMFELHVFMRFNPFRSIRNPTALYVNQESRNVVKRLYIIVFQNISFFTKMKPCAYFNLSRDTLCFYDTMELRNYMYKASDETRMQIHKELKYLQLKVLVIIMPRGELLSVENVRNVIFPLPDFWDLDTLLINRLEFIVGRGAKPGFELIAEVLTQAWKEELSREGYLGRKLPRIVQLKDN